MSLTPSHRDESLIIEVTIFEHDVVTETRTFESILEAEAFAEQWTERVPGTRYEIEDRTHDHTAWQAAEAETALSSDYPQADDS